MEGVVEIMKINILIVDDEVRIRDLLGAYLTKEGYNIYYASNGKEALDIFKDDIINRYHEYEFAYIKEEKNYHGFIDLLLETNDKFIIVDYKLKNIDKEEYHDQLKVYYEFLESITDKKIEAYLYSIIDNMWKKIEDF